MGFVSIQVDYWLYFSVFICVCNLIVVLADVLPIILKCKCEANQIKQLTVFFLCYIKYVKLIFLGLNVHLEPEDYTTKCDNL